MTKFFSIFRKLLFVVAVILAFGFVCNNPKSASNAVRGWFNGHHDEVTAEAMNSSIEAFGFSNTERSRKAIVEMYSMYPHAFSEDAIAKVEACGVNLRGNGSAEQTPAPTPAPTPVPVTKVSEEITKQPTCTETGELTIKYSDGHAETQELPALGHQYELSETVDPTCGIEGYNEYTCTRCGDSYRETIPALEHKWELAETIESTCDKDGKRIYKCKICGETKEEIIPTKEHVLSDWQIVKEAGFFTEGEKQIVCTVCGEVLETEAIPAKQDWRVWLVCGAGLIALATIVSVIIIKKKTTK